MVEVTNEGMRKALQKGGVNPDSPISTMVHELIHWADLQEYEITTGIKVTRENRWQYEEYLQRKSKGVLDKLNINAYNVDKISDYATQMLTQNNYVEVYTEIRTKELLK